GPRPRRVLRRALGARPDAPHGPGHGRGAHHVPGPCVVGLRRRAARAAQARPRDPSRRRPAAPHGHGLGAALTAGRSAMAAGTQTFLFSDVEGSTRLEQAIGTARYAQVRERHRELLRAAFAANSGDEQGTEGDSFFVVFPSASAGVQAAVAAQRALLTEPWPDDVTLRVRMGLHAGEAEAVGGTLVGRDVNRAARIAAVANGGQVVPSDAVGALVSGELPDGVSLRPLGSHRLKDLREPEALAQVIAEGLPDTFPPLR